jgi:hypothetical protein
MAITYGIDLASATSFSYTTSYGGYFESPLYTVGTPLVKRQFSQIEWQLAKELATDQGIRVKFRVNLTDSWTTIGTWTYAMLGAVISQNTAVNIPDCEFIQIRVELLGTSSSSPEFKTLILK